MFIIDMSLTIKHRWFYCIQHELTRWGYRSVMGPHRLCAWWSHISFGIVPCRFFDRIFGKAFVFRNTICIWCCFCFPKWLQFLDLYPFDLFSHLVSVECSLIDYFVRYVFGLNYFFLQLVDAIHLQVANVFWVLHSVENLSNSDLIQSRSFSEIRILISLRVYLLNDSEIRRLLLIKLGWVLHV